MGHALHRTVLSIFIVFTIGAGLGFFGEEVFRSKRINPAAVLFLPGEKFFTENRLMYSSNYFERIEAYYMLQEENFHDISFLLNIFSREEVTLNRAIFLWVTQRVLDEKKLVEFYNSIYSKLNKKERQRVIDNYRRKYGKEIKIKPGD